MKNYRRSLMSIAASLAISSTILTAGYIPLTTTAPADNQWVLFGVSGYKTEGAVAAVAGAFSITADAENIIVDDTADEIAVTGMTRGTGDLGLLKVMDGNTNVSLEVRVDTSTFTYNPTEPLRTMYVDVDGDDAADFSFTYKASLENSTLEYSVDGGQVNEVTISYMGVFDNPSVGQVTTAGGATGTRLVNLINTEDDSLVDYDFADNPPLSSEYNASLHKSAIGDANLRMFSYEASAQRWDIFDTGNTAGTNDFTTVALGKAYWGKIDTNGGNEEAGFVVGSSNADINTSTYSDANISEGWNLMSFSGANSEIRHAGTGLIVEFDADTVAQTMTIMDASGNHEIQLTFTALSDDSDAELCKFINSEIDQAKSLGTLPSTFDITAIPTGTATFIALLSDKKFSIKDDGDDDIAEVTTLTGAAPWDEVSETYAAPGDLVDEYVTSVYGEYALVIEPLIATGTAQFDTLSGSALDVNGTVIALAGNGAAGDDTIGEAVTAIDLALAADFVINSLDLDFDGTAEHVLITNPEPFYVRDNTFTRVYDYDNTEAVVGTFQFRDVGDNVADFTDTVAGGDTTAANVVTAVNQANMGVIAVAAQKVAFINPDEGGSDFKVLETVGDKLTLSSSSVDAAKGAVKAVYSTNYLARKGVRNDIVVEAPALGGYNDALDEIHYDLITVYGTRLASAAPNADTTFLPNPTGTYTDAQQLAEHVTFLENLIADYGLTATVTTTGVMAAGDAITVTGPDIIGITPAVDNDQNADDGADTPTATTDLGYIEAVTADLATDLQYNTVYSPDYVMDGPLYTMRDNNYSLEALVSGYTDLSDGSVSWDSIDLTRNPSEWLDSQDYNLFDIDEEAGYWAYLVEDATANPLGLSNASLSLNYSYQFDSALTSVATFNYFAGNLNVDVSGLSEVDSRKSARVTAVISGKTIELSRVGSSNTYTGKIGTYTNGLAFNQPYSIVINVADGLGNNYSEIFDTLLDNTKPEAPTAEFVGGNLEVSSADAGVNGFYVFSGEIPEDDTANSALAFLPTAGTISDVCSELDQAVFGAAATGIRVFAVDGTGILGGGNASDSVGANFLAIKKSRVVLSDTNNAGDVTASQGGDVYDALCANTGAITVNTGVTLAAITSDTVASLAYGSRGEVLVTSVPFSVYLSDGLATETIVRVTFPSNYNGDDIYVKIAGVVHEYQLDNTIAVGAPGTTSGNPLDISGVGSNPMDTIDF